jgi:hypothetical protein
MGESYDYQSEAVSSGRSSISMKKIFFLGVVVVYVLLSSYGLYSAHRRLGMMEQKLDRTAALQQRVSALEATNATLASRMGMTQKELEQRAVDLQKAQRAAESRLSAAQKEQITAVSGEVAGVKTEVGTVKSDTITLKSELELTKAKLERAIGDLGLQSGLIAHTRDELEVLKHRGDKNYYEFTLTKGNSTPVGTISLELRKTDPKRSKFTLNVLADDRKIEKKDRTANEPLQFYSGRDRLLYEIVVNSVQKDHISGYLATPKAAPQPVIAQ